MEWISGMVAAAVALFAALFAAVTPTLSYIASPLPEPPKTATILFAGDMMFDRSIRLAMEKEGPDFILSCMKTELEKPDAVVANLEGPITANPSVSVGSAPGSANNFTFTFPPYVAPLIYAHNIRIVNLGNNHILNFGEAGVLSTIGYLDQAGVMHFGSPLDNSVLDTEVNGISLTFVNYNEFGLQSLKEAASTTLMQITEAKARGRIVVVFTHWGAEYVAAHPYDIRLAHSFIDAGAELVIGTHPHVIQEHEVYNGKHIYYSLGNFIFDQYWEDKVRKGLMVEVSFGEGGAQSVREITTELERNRQTCIVESST